MEKRSNRTNPIPIEDGVFDVPILVEADLERQRAQLRDFLLSAQRRLRRFAHRFGWDSRVREPFAQQAHFYAHKSSFDQDLRQIGGLDPDFTIPSTYCAALEQGVLVVVSPALYRSLYPEGDEQNAFEKLLTHEMAHRLHIRILGGNEQAMGPVWFYEGFALYAAGQMEDSAPGLSPEEIWKVVGAEERQDYRRYVTVFHYFLRCASLQQLVERAGQAGFQEWLKKICE